MRIHRILSAVALSVMALPALARDYLAYDLETQEVSVFTADGVDPEAYRGSSLLFIKSPDGIWLGALEVTNAQAGRLGGWGESSTNGDARAFTRDNNSASLPAPPALPSGLFRYPTEAELRNAWHDTPPFPTSTGLSGKYNLKTGVQLAPLPAAWAATEPNGLGYFDILGNAAEYTSDGGTYIGGCHLTAYNSPNFTNTPTGDAVLGFRLVYVGPTEKTYPVTVDGSALGDYVPGTEVTFEPAVPEGHYIDAWSAEPQSVAAELTGGAEESFTMPDQAVTITYTYKPWYTVTVTVNHEGGTPKTEALQCKAGQKVTPEPHPEAGYRIDGPPVLSPDDLSPAEDGSFTMPEEDVSVTYTARPYVTLTVIGGTASGTAPFLGEEVTLSPTPGVHQVFRSWGVAPEGLTLKGNTLTVPAEGPSPGSTYTVTAAFDTAPRILVYGGTVTAGSPDQDLGNGYYAVGTRLEMAAEVPEGCVFKGWKTDGSEALRTDTVYTVQSGDINTVRTFTAVFEISDSAVGEATLRFGLDTQDAAYANFGYDAQAKSRDLDANTLIAPVYTPRTETYALFDLTDGGTLTFGNSLPETSTTSVLPLKRVESEGRAPFYLGVYETSNAHVANLFDADKYKSYVENTYAYVMEGNNRDWVRGPFAGDTQVVLKQLDSRFLSTLNAVSRLPMKEDIIAAAGRGATKDLDEEGKEKISASMVNAPGTSFYTADGVAVPVGGENSKEVDPYGFYNMWGNYLEALGNGGKERAGVTGGYASNIFKECHIDFTDPAPRAWAISFRPLIPVTETIAVTVKIGEASAAIQLLPGKPIVRADETPVLAGHEFSHWQWSDGTRVDGETLAAAEDDGKVLQAVFTTRTIHEIDMTYSGCTGPAKLIAGSSTTVYTEGEIESFAVTDGLTAEKSADGRSLRLSAPAETGLTEATVAVTLKRSRPGFRLRLR